MIPKRIPGAPNTEKRMLDLMLEEQEHKVRKARADADRAELELVLNATKCHACSIEAEFGTAENPHPIEARFHKCVRRT